MLVNVKVGVDRPSRGQSPCTPSRTKSFDVLAGLRGRFDVALALARVPRPHDWLYTAPCTVTLEARRLPLASSSSRGEPERAPAALLPLLHPLPTSVCILNRAIVFRALRRRLARSRGS